MVSFVESATLRLNDRNVVTQIRRVNNELRKLNTTAQGLRRTLAGLDFNRMLGNGTRSSGVTRAITDLRQLNAELTRLRGAASRPVTVRTVTAPVAPGSTTSPVPAGGRVPRYYPRGGFGFGRYGLAGGISGLSVQRMIVYAGAVSLGGAAVRAAMEGQRADAAIDATVQSPQTRALIRAAAEAAVIDTRRISSTRAEEIALDTYRSGARGSELSRLTGLLASYESAAGFLSPGLDTQSLTLLTNRVLNLGNALGDAERQAQLVAGTFGAAVVAGESFNSATFLAALRTSGFATTINREGLVGLGLLVDAQGRQAGSGLNRLRKELSTPLGQAGAGAGIAKGAVESLIAEGIRGVGGITLEEQRAFEQDPLQFIQTVLAGRIRSQGVNLEDRAAIRQFLQTAGFSVTSQRVMLDALTSIEETMRAREVAAGIADPKGLDNNLLTNMPAALENLASGFNTFSRSVLTPLFETIAPSVTVLGDSLKYAGLWIDNLSDSTKEAAAQTALMAGGAATAFAVFKTAQGALGLMRAGPALVGAAANLDAAALALQRAAGAQLGAGIGGGNGRGKPGPLGGFSGGGIGGFLAAFGWIAAAGTAAGDINEYFRDPEGYRTRRLENWEAKRQDSATRERNFQHWWENTVPRWAQIFTGTADQWQATDADFIGPRLPARPGARPGSLMQRHALANSPLPYVDFRQVAAAVQQQGTLGGIVANIDAVEQSGKKTLSVAELAAIKAGTQASASIVLSGQQAGDAVGKSMQDAADTMRQVTIDMSSILEDTFMRAGPAMGQSIATYLEEAIIRGAQRAQFRWPGASRAGVNTTADLGYSGSGDSGSSVGVGLIGTYGG